MFRSGEGRDCAPPVDVGLCEQFFRCKLRRFFTVAALVGSTMGPIEDGLLAYMKAYRLRADMGSLKRCVLDVYDDKAIRNAKDALWSACNEELKQLKVEYSRRRATSNRSQGEADFDDIAVAFDALDKEDKLPVVHCSSDDLLLMPSPLPPRGVESVADEVRVLRKDIETKMSQLNERIALISDSVKVSSQSTLQSSTQSASGVSHNRPQVADNSERHSNVVLFGVKEERGLSEVHKVVNSILETAAGKQIPIKDMFRIGRKPQGNQDATAEAQPQRRPRPILVKLQSVWDRRLLLAGKWKLRDTEGFREFFLRADLSVEERERIRAKYSQGRNRGSPNPDV